MPSPADTQEDAEDLLAPQMPVLFDILEGCGIPVVGHPGAEAEDVIGTLARRARGKVGIVSGDRDLFQLVRDPKVVVLYPRRGVSQLDVVDESYVRGALRHPGPELPRFRGVTRRSFRWVTGCTGHRREACKLVGDALWEPRRDPE